MGFHTSCATVVFWPFGTDVTHIPVVLVPEADGNELAVAGVGLAGLLAGTADFPVV
jgi:hypothetical protein